MAQSRNSQKIVIEPRSARVDVGETVQFSAKIVDRNGQETDTSFTWSVSATGFGSITEEGLFTGLARGRGNVYAAIGDLTGSSHVTVVDTTCPDTLKTGYSHLAILPLDTLILVGESVQFSAQLLDTSGMAHDTTAVWELRGNSVGSLTDEGLFTAQDRGVGLIRATVGRWSATTRIRVATASDTAARDSVSIRFRDRDGQIKGNPRRMDESDIFVISGLPFPLNMLNGAELIFPDGSLEQGIDIDIHITDAALIDVDSTVSYADQILNGIRFDVYVNDTLISPYYFSEPVQLILPFKQDLLNTLGLTIDDLWMFFYESSGDFSDDGITNVFVDTSLNKIYADIIHFSDLVIASKNSETTSVGDSGPVMPQTFELYGNSPNPFNPETEIRFMVPGSNDSHVTITIFNLLGRRVKTLLNQPVSPGNHTVLWNGKDDRQHSVPSGVYFYQLKSGKTVISRKMTLMK